MPFASYSTRRGGGRGHHGGGEAQLGGACGAEEGRQAGRRLRDGGGRRPRSAAGRACPSPPMRNAGLFIGSKICRKTRRPYCLEASEAPPRDSGGEVPPTVPCSRATRRLPRAGLSLFGACTVLAHVSLIACCSCLMPILNVPARQNTIKHTVSRHSCNQQMHLDDTVTP